MMKEKVLEVQNLSTSFHTERGLLKAIDGVSFDVYKGEILGVVGESGCGKSVTSQSIMRLYDEKYAVKYSGRVLLNGRNLFDIPYKRMQDVRGAEISMILQPSSRLSSAMLILSPFLRTMSIMLMAMTTGMPSSVSWVVR